MTPDAVLSGELGLLSLFDLGQLLMLNGATGELTVTNDGRRGYFYFDRGQIVNAVDDEYHEGEGAAHRLFTWRAGKFEFRPQPSTGSRAILESTEGLMLEAARRMDEAGDSQGSTAQKLQQRAGALEALREVFQSVARETSAVPEADHELGGSPFALLAEPGDALLFRPGHAPRLLQHGRWRDAGTQALDGAAFEQLRSRLLDGVWPPAGTSARAPGVHTFVVAWEDGRRYAVTRAGGAHEALWVRAAEQSPAGAEALDGDVAALHALLAEHSGLVLVGGRDAVSADRLLHACVGELTRRRGGTVLLAADHGLWRHEDGAGALVRAGAEDVAAMLRVFTPETAAFDVAHAGASLAALHAAPLVLAAVVAPAAEAVPAHWAARIGGESQVSAPAWLANATLGVVYTPGADATSGRLAFQLARSDAAGPLADLVPANPGATPRAVDAPAAPAAAAPASDPMAALAAELTRTLRKAA